MSNHAAASPQQGPQLKRISALIVGAALVIAVALFICDAQINLSFSRMVNARERYISASLAASRMNTGSDYLTDRVRCFTVTGDLQYLRDYFEEAQVTRRRDGALDELEELLEGSDSTAYVSLAKALDYSNELMEHEYLAMRLTQSALGYPDQEVPEAVSRIVLTAEDEALSPDARQAKAQALVFDEEYMNYKALIRANVSMCTDELIKTTGGELSQAAARLNRQLTLQTVLTIALLLTVCCLVVFIFTQVLVPLSRMVRRIREKRMIDLSGAEELRFVISAYNEITEENQKARQDLTYEVMHDPLTGLYNRRAYDMFIQDVDLAHAALLIIDVDDFKSINDTYGHDGGDRVLKSVARLLHQTFRSTDLICRIGGDEFAVIMTRVNSDQTELVKGKVTRLNERLQHPEGLTPVASISVGAAFSDRKNPQGDLFKDADTALYRVKEQGRKGCAIYGEETHDGQ